MTAIVSPHNPKLKHLRRLQRRRERERTGEFLAEGEDLIDAAAAAGWTPLAGYRTPGSTIGGDVFSDVEPEALAPASTLGSGTRAIAIYEQRYVAAPAGPLCLFLHGVSDPGNVGAAMRSAQAFGASCVALGSGCADPFGPKAVRASMGAIFAVPLARAEGVAQLPGNTVALVPRRGVALAELALAGGPVSILVGAEREGLPEEVIGACTHTAHIPIAAESLNVAMAATVALYELARRESNRVPAS